MRRRRRGIPDPYLVGKWTLGQPNAVGTTIFDISGDRNNGISANTPVFTYDQNGVPNQGFVFNGISDVITTQSIDIGTVHTTCAWIKLDSSPSINNSVFGSSADDATTLFVYTQSGSERIYYDNNIDASVYVEWIGWNDYDWHYITSIRNGTSVDFYVDGLQVGITQTLASNPSMNKTWVIGRWGGNKYIKGNLSDIAIYSEAKSAGWVLQQYLGNDIRQSLIQGDNSNFDTVGDWIGSGATLTGGYDSGDAGHDKTLRIEADDPSNNRAELAVTDWEDTPVVGNTYLIQFDYKYIVAPTSNSSIGMLGVINTDLDKDALIWTKYSAEIVALDNSTQLRVYVNVGGGTANDELLIDNVSVVNITP